MSRRRNQGPAYDLATSTMLRGVAIPPKLKCSRCDKYKGHNSFSETQLNHARMAIKSHTRYTIKCDPCNGKRIVEIECSFCGKTQGLEMFAKTQRNKPDSAKCFTCTDVQLGTDPVQEERYEEQGEAFEPVENSDGSWPDYFQDNGTATNASEAGDEDDARSDDGGGISLRNDLRNLSVNTATLIESDDIYSNGPKALSGTNNNIGGPVKLGGNGWTVAQSKSWNSRSPAPSANSGFNTNVYGNPASRGGTTSVSGTSRTFNSNFTEPSNDQPAKGTWAKIKAYVPPKKEEPEDDWKSDSEEEADDDSDDSDTNI
ncbi:hypothetical protein K505DRAFT_358965 [Melanomma pulvis-pyrius CBS 109.77]|uniref:Stc1 domain-containing protein n=1 Tax=Melanomma pulvis-pyrius CBS 109.77 TaxID=1314802 RepID=A0A6A6XK55_9PLEO|nr:hypothetical protein K505DRAFT_358965 [Melanomma pulvis-pyrius CBS 109.77]